MSPASVRLQPATCPARKSICRVSGPENWRPSSPTIWQDLAPKDIDVVELHDCFSIATLIALESLGFFEFGKSGEAVEKGETKIGGKMPVNPSGGLKAKGHPIGATGTAQVYEIVRQLRGECGERQVEGAKIGMTDTLGGDGGTLCNVILKRGW